MSFCNNNSTPDRCPGNINGNPMNGLCEKVCIQTVKIFDACMLQTSIDATVALTSLAPANPTLPLTFTSGSSTSQTGTITALTITPIADRQGLSRVTANRLHGRRGQSRHGYRLDIAQSRRGYVRPHRQRHHAKHRCNRQRCFSARRVRERQHLLHHLLRDGYFERTSTRQPSHSVLRLLQNPALYGI